MQPSNDNTLDINHPLLVAKRIAAVAHLQGVRLWSPAWAMVKNNAHYLRGPASHGAVTA